VPVLKTVTLKILEFFFPVHLITAKNRNDVKLFTIIYCNITWNARCKLIFTMKSFPQGFCAIGLDHELRKLFRNAAEIALFKFSIINAFCCPINVQV